MQTSPFGRILRAGFVVNAEDLVFLPWCKAVHALRDRPLRFRVLTPPYAAVGVGALRALRVKALSGEHDGAWELVAGYEGYERL